MTNRLLAVLIAASILTFATNDLRADGHIDQSVGHTKLDIAFREYEIRLDQFRQGNFSASAVLQANEQLLRVSLTFEKPTAGVEYEQHAKEIERTVSRIVRELGYQKQNQTKTE